MRTPINITSQTVYTNVDLTDDLFNIYAGASLLLGNDFLTDDALAMSGFARFRAPITIDDGLTLEDAVMLTNASVVTQSGALAVGQSSTDTVTVRNLAGATWDLAADANIGGYVSSEFINRGLLDQLGGQSTIAANFYDRGGTIEINGALNFTPGNDVNRFVDDTITGPGNLLLGSLTGTTPVLDGTTISTENTTIIDARIVGTVDISSASFSTPFGNGINLASGSHLNLTNPAASLLLSDISGAGTMDLEGNDNVSTMGTYVFTGAVTFTNSGNTHFGTQLIAHTNYPTIYFETNPWSDDQVSIVNAAGATWTDGGAGTTAFVATGVTGSSVFDNEGTFVEDTYDGGVTFGFGVINDGTIEAGPDLGPVTTHGSPSYLGFQSSVTGSGIVEVGPIDVDFASSVAGGQFVNFNVGAADLTPTLSIEDPADFAATITGFDIGATNDKIAVNTATWAYQDFVPDGGGAGGALMFTNGSAETAINLTGTYDPLGFHVAVGGTTTTITYFG